MKHLILNVSFITSLVVISFYRDAHAQNLNWEWAKTVHGAVDIIPSDVAGDRNDNVIVCYNNINGRFFIGQDTVYGKGGADVLISKYNSAGNLEWVKSHGGSGNEFILSSCTDSENNIYITGGFSTDIMVFDKDTLSNHGNTDLYIAKYKSDGSVIWAKNIGSSSYETGKIARYNADGSIIVCWQAEVNGYVTMEKDSFFVKSGQLLTKFTKDGRIEWTTSTQDMEMLYMCTSKSGDITIAGYMINTIIINNDTISKDKSKRLVICNFGPDGKLKWFNQSEGSHLLGIATDTNNNVYCIGDYEKKASIFGIELSQFENFTYYFVASLDSSGNARWAKGIANEGDLSAFSICISNTQKIILSGRASGFADFGGGIEINKKPNEVDYFLAAYNVDGVTEWVEPTIMEVWSISYNNPKSVIIAGRLDRTQFLGDIEVKEVYNQHTAFIAKAKEGKLSAVRMNNSNDGKTYSAYYQAESGELTIQSNQVLQYPCTIKVYDVLGKMVISSTFSSGDAQRLTIGAADLSNGAYSLEITSEHQSAYSKVMVVK